MNGKGYVIMGWVNGSNHGGVYEYDPGLNSWTAKNNFPGPPRYGPCVFLLNNKAYIGLGYNPLHDDLWQYDPANDTWSQKANFPGGPRQATVHFALNGLGYVGCGVSNLSSYAGLDDFYTYDDVLNTWTQIGNFAGPARHSAVSFVLNNKAYVTTGNTGNAPGTTFNDLWEFNPVGAVWTQLSPLPDTGRQSGSAFEAGNCGYIFGGFNQLTGTFFSQLWQYCDGTGVEETENSVRANLYPCPGSRTFVFKHSLSSAVYRLDIISIEGKTIFSEKIIQPETKINLSSYAQGVYVWKFYKNSVTLKTGKIII
jgi:N-acetylneuraminic acid mutarotase